MPATTYQWTPGRFEQTELLKHESPAGYRFYYWRGDSEGKYWAYFVETNRVITSLLQPDQLRKSVHYWYKVNRRESGSPVSLVNSQTGEVKYHWQSIYWVDPNAPKVIEPEVVTAQEPEPPTVLETVVSAPIQTADEIIEEPVKEAPIQTIEPVTRPMIPVPDSSQAPEVVKQPQVTIVYDEQPPKKKSNNKLLIAGAIAAAGLLLFNKE